MRALAMATAAVFAFLGWVGWRVKVEPPVAPPTAKSFKQMTHKQQVRHTLWYNRKRDIYK